MNTALTLKIDSTDLAATLHFAAGIGHRVRGGEVFELVSDLGGGKTSFVKGLAQGMGSDDQVHSPSFTISNQYRAREFTLYHFDFYRLADPGIMRQELAEVLGDNAVVVAVEWAEAVSDVLPVERGIIELRTRGENERQITVTVPKSLAYLIAKT